MCNKIRLVEVLFNKGAKVPLSYHTSASRLLDIRGTVCLHTICINVWMVLSTYVSFQGIHIHSASH